MSRQLAFSSAVSIMLMATFALSVTVKAQDAVPFAAARVIAGGR